MLFILERVCHIAYMDARVVLMRRPTARPGSVSLLDRVAAAFVAQPAASLAELAAAAGVARTTLHKHYPTRNDLVLAVGHHVIDQCGRAVTEALAQAPAEPVERLRRIVAALVPVGAQLAFMFRQPELDADAGTAARQASELDEPIMTAVRAARAAGHLREDQPEWWTASAIYALIYIAWEGVERGVLAPVDAPGLAMDTFLSGVGSARR
jgi:AcrR family transcriptional regulator